MSVVNLRAVITALLASLGALCLYGASAAPAGSSNVARVQIFYEPQDEASTRLLKQQLAPLLETGLAERVDLTLVPSGRSSCESVGQDVRCTCPRGAKECLIMHLMSCTLHDYDRQRDAAALIGCMQGQSTLANATSACVQPLPNRAANWLRECPRQFRGRYLSWLDSRRTTVAVVDTSNLPAVVIDGERDAAAVRDLRAQICERLAQPRPVEC